MRYEGGTGRRGASRKLCLNKAEECLDVPLLRAIAIANRNRDEVIRVIDARRLVERPKVPDQSSSKRVVDLRGLLWLSD